MKILLMYKPTPGHFKRLSSVAPGATFVIASTEAAAKKEIVNADIVLGNKYFIQALPCAKKLKFMQSNSVGMDLILSSALMRKNRVILANAKGVYDNDLADHALALFLAVARGLHIARDNQQIAQWQRWAIDSLSAGQALILGYGGIGEKIAQRLSACNIKTYAACKHPAQTLKNTKYLQKLLGPQQWRKLLPKIRYLFIALPLTAETRGLLGKREFAALPQNAIIVNISRGEIIVEDVLKNVLRQGKLAGVGLDVFTAEPLPKNHWLWSAKRILVSPHLGRSIEQNSFKWETLFENNLKNFINKKPLLNVVDKKAGY